MIHVADTACREDLLWPALNRPAADDPRLAYTFKAHTLAVERVADNAELEGAFAADERLPGRAAALRKAAR